MTAIVPFADIGKLSVLDPIRFEGPFGTISGYVSEVVPGEYVSIMTGGAQAVTRVTAESCQSGVLVVDDAGLVSMATPGRLDLVRDVCTGCRTEKSVSGACMCGAV